MNPEQLSNYGISQELMRLKTSNPELMAEAAKRIATLRPAPVAEPAASGAPCRTCEGSFILSMNPALVINGSDAALEELRKRLAASAPPQPVAMRCADCGSYVLEPIPKDAA